MTKSKEPPNWARYDVGRYSPQESDSIYRWGRHSKLERLEDGKPTRRTFVKAILLSAPLYLTSGSLTSIKDKAEAHTGKLINLGARDAVERIHRGEMKAEAYVAELLQWYAAHKRLNTIITIDEGRVLREARAVDLARARGSKLGPLAGLPFAVKDQMDVAGYPTTTGNACLRGYIARRTATVADVLMKAGGLMFAKTNCAVMVGSGYILTAVTSSNPFFGFVRNPYDVTRVPGGSSGGNGAAIAARIVPAAIGEDTSGSIRIPSSFSGVAGFRPSTYTLANALNGTRRKRYPDDGMVPPANTMDTWGPMARTVADVAFLDSVITGQCVPDVKLHDVRIGIPRSDFWDQDVFDRGVVKVILEAFARLRDAGARLIEFDLDSLLGLDQGDRLGSSLRRSDDRFTDWLRKNLPSVTMNDIHTAMKSVQGMQDVDRAALYPNISLSAEEKREWIERASRAHAELFRNLEIMAVAFPTEPTTAPLINANGDTPGQHILVDGSWVNESFTLLRYTRIGPRLGAPGLSLPAGMSDGLPVGLELEALPGDDSRLLGIGIAVENVLGPIPPPPSQSLRK